MAKKKSEKQIRYDWLVRCRSDNQAASLRLYELLDQLKDEANPPLRDFGVDATGLVAVSFSLWRAVFLCDSDRPAIVDYVTDAHAFLETLIEDNAITYAQDKRTREWTAFYYINNARHRLRSLSDTKSYLLPNFVSQGRNTREIWEELQGGLNTAIGNLTNAVVKARTTKKR